MPCAAERANCKSGFALRRRDRLHTHTEAHTAYSDTHVWALRAGCYSGSTSTAVPYASSSAAACTTIDVE